MQAGGAPASPLAVPARAPVAVPIAPPTIAPTGPASAAPFAAPFISPTAAPDTGFDQFPGAGIAYCAIAALDVPTARAATTAKTLSLVAIVISLKDATDRQSAATGATLRRERGEPGPCCASLTQ